MSPRLLLLPGFLALFAACASPQPEAEASVTRPAEAEFIAEEQPEWIEFRLETKDDVPALTGEHWLRVIAEGPSLDAPEQRIEKELRVIAPPDTYLPSLLGDLRASLNRSFALTSPVSAGSTLRAAEGVFIKKLELPSDLNVRRIIFDKRPEPASFELNVAFGRSFTI